MFFDLRTLGNGKQLETRLSQVEKGEPMWHQSRQMRGENKANPATGSYFLSATRSLASSKACHIFSSD
jgi:hypothetical protein